MSLKPSLVKADCLVGTNYSKLDNKVHTLNHTTKSARKSATTHSQIRIHGKHARKYVTKYVATTKLHYSYIISWHATCCIFYQAQCLAVCRLFPLIICVTYFSHHFVACIIAQYVMQYIRLSCAFIQVICYILCASYLFSNLLPCYPKGWQHLLSSAFFLQLE